MRISWGILTWNRADMVQASVRHNMAHAGCEWDELLWVDNGSTDHTHKVMEEFPLQSRVRLDQNYGIPFGHNLLMRRATGDIIVIIGSDMLMPDNWLLDFKRHFEAIPEAALVSMYDHPLEKVKERALPKRGTWVPQTINGLDVWEGLAIGRISFRRALFEKAGYCRQDFGLYGYDDLEWATRAVRVCNENGWKSLVIPGIPEHLGTEGSCEYDGKDSPEYYEWKQAQIKDPAKLKLLMWCHQKNYPYYNPYKAS